MTRPSTNEADLPDANGDCYLVAARTTMALADALPVTMVHGVASGRGELKGFRIGHGWVEVEVGPESERYVLELSNGHNAIIPADVYYMAGEIDPDNAEEFRRYTPEETRELLEEHGHYGPWHITGGV